MRTVLYWGMVPTVLWNGFRNLRTVLHCGIVSEVCVLYFYCGMVPTVLWNGFRNLRTVLHCGMVSEACVLYFIVEWYLLYVEWL
ncbi:hypothetical protein CEXT_533931 [Caerostris extrusa]|uniref:Transmembrane protein n=1 Tax=Caerostris extrusa TaxID=172846 RepID=A0AAV4P4E0_CAEEX|nr:hypothetical protein CEXT_533931 [Caerostris extrusa]